MKLSTRLVLCIATCALCVQFNASQANSQVGPKPNYRDYLRQIQTQKIQILDAKIASIDYTSTFNTFLKLTGLNKTIQSGQYTIFVPTNRAFCYLSQTPDNADSVETQMAYLANPAQLGMLKKLIGSHIVEGRINFETLKTGGEITTITGDVIFVISNQNGVVKLKSNTGIEFSVNIAENFNTSNGIIAISDKVSVPRSTEQDIPKPSVSVAPTSLPEAKPVIPTVPNVTAPPAVVEPEEMPDDNYPEQSFDFEPE